MGKIYCVLGKSSCGKDTIYREIVKNEKLQLKTIVPYTTRPIREGETDGQEYHFVTQEDVERLRADNRIIELRTYQTVYGPWHYFTVDDGQIDLTKYNYIYIVTLEGYLKIRDYYGAASIVPIYIEVEDGERLIRAIQRERTQAVPKYEEMCRRFLADSADFSEEKLKEGGITTRFSNTSFEETVDRIIEFIEEDYEGKRD